MRANPEVYNVSLPDTYYRFFEVGAGFFITQGGAKDFASSYDFEKYSELIGGEADPTSIRNETTIQGKF